MTQPTQPSAPTLAPDYTAAAPQAKRKRRVFFWVFLALQVIFLIWAISAGSAHNDSCAHLNVDDCNAAQDLGKGIGVFLIIVVWFFVDAILGISYGIYRLAKR